MASRVASRALIALGCCVALCSTPIAAFAHEGTPVVASTDRMAFIPAPEECIAEPLTDEALAEVADASTEASPVSVEPSDIPFGAPDGTPADAQTAEDMTAIVRASWACLNGGDWARFFAYLTTDEIRRSFGPDAASLASQPVGAFPVENQTAVYAVLDVEVLPDGRVGAFVLVDTPGDPLPVEINYQVATMTEDGLKLDGFICFSGTGTVC